MERPREGNLRARTASSGALQDAHVVSCSAFDLLSTCLVILGSLCNNFPQAMTTGLRLHGDLPTAERVESLVDTTMTTLPGRLLSGDLLPGVLPTAEREESLVDTETMTTLPGHLLSGDLLPGEPALTTVEESQERQRVDTRDVSTASIHTQATMSIINRNSE